MMKTLFLASTPIGNLSDVSARIMGQFEQADVIIAEDTRETKKLFELLGIPLNEKKFFSFHEHNQNEVKDLVAKVMEFEKPLLVSDAGSPVLSDPGFPFVKEWLFQGGELTSIPGPSSVVVALELSGLPPVPFMFHGFLPKKKEAKKSLFLEVSPNTTHIFFESPHRIHKTIDELFESHPEAEVAIGRELTKKFEEVLRFKKSEWESSLKENLKEKGEFVLLFNYSGSSVKESTKAKDFAQDYLERPSTKKLAKILSELTGDEISSVYDKLNR